MKKYYIGVDLGGTNIAAGLVTKEGEIVCKDSIPTRSGRMAAEIAADMAGLAKGVIAKGGLTAAQITAIGMGVPGTANRQTGRVEFANNLGFYDEPLLELIGEYFPDIPVTFDNDANAAAWGEYIAGSGKGCRSMLAVTLGTGIGGGIILDGKLFEGVNYAAGEFGHFVIDRNGIPCNCGRRGCYENYASATALVRQTREAMEKAPDSLLWDLCGGKSEAVEGKTLFEGVRKGDDIAAQVLDQYVRYLGIGLIDLVNIFQPELICIGGGISKAGDLLLAPLQDLLDREDYARSARNRTRLVIASLGNDAGLIGAALLPQIL